MTPPSVRALVLLVMIAAMGCSLSASSESSSKIVSSPIESSSKSSESSLKSNEDRYRDQVRDHTVAYVRSSGDPEALRVQVADVARQRGISDWEASNATWQGVGQGLARSGVKGPDFESRLIALTGSDPARMSTVRAAYDRERQR